MDTGISSKFKKAESWKEFYTIFNQYIFTLSDSRDCDLSLEDRDEAYDMLVKDWAEYCSVNKSYIHKGTRELKDKINKQMIYLLLQEHDILTYFLNLFFAEDKEEKVQNFSAIKTWINNEFATEDPALTVPTTNVTMSVKPVATFDTDTVCVKKEDVTDRCVGGDSSVLIDFLGNDLPKMPAREEMVEDEEKGASEKEDVEPIPDLEDFVTNTLVGGAKIIGKIVGAVDDEINSVADEINSMGKPRMVKVKVEGPRRLDFLSSIVDFLPPDISHIIETKENDYDIGIYAFDHDDWGDLDTVKEKLPTGRRRIACNIGVLGGDIYMEPLFKEVWELERYNKQEILRKLRFSYA
jgi:hypothetical protein